jgi:hypothetical protein
VVRSTQGETQSLPLVHAWGRARPLLRFPSGECGGGVSARATGSLAVPQLRAACTLPGGRLRLAAPAAAARRTHTSHRPQSQAGLEPHCHFDTCASS